MRDPKIPVRERIARATHQLGQHPHGWDDTSPHLQALYLAAVDDALADTSVTALSVVEAGKAHPTLMEGDVELADLSDHNLPRLRRALGDLNALALLGREALGGATPERPPTPQECAAWLRASHRHHVETFDRVKGEWAPVFIKAEGWDRLPNPEVPRLGHRLASTEATPEPFTVTKANVGELLGRSIDGETIGWMEVGETLVHLYPGTSTLVGHVAHCAVRHWAADRGVRGSGTKALARRAYSAAMDLGTFLQALADDPEGAAVLLRDHPQVVEQLSSLPALVGAFADGLESAAVQARAAGATLLGQPGEAGVRTQLVGVSESMTGIAGALGKGVWMIGDAAEGIGRVPMMEPPARQLAGAADEFGSATESIKEMASSMDAIAEALAQLGASMSVLGTQLELSGVQVRELLRA